MKHRFLAKRYWNTMTTPMGAVVDLAKQYSDVINLSLGDPDYVTNQEVIQRAFEDAENGHTHYTDSLGDEELRHEIIKYYEEAYEYKVGSKEVMAVVGACHGMYLALEAILDDGDEVIIPAPYFTPYIQQVELVRGKPVILDTYEEDGFQIDINRLKGLINHRTKAIIINTPNNPTGACFSKETLEAVGKVAKEFDLLIIADDIYDAFTFSDPFLPATTMKGMQERTITIGSFSKDYAMTGWRVGYVLAPDFIIQCMRDINEGICFTVPSISQRAAIYALRMRETIQPPMIAEYKKRMYYAYERINAIPNMSVLSPQGSFYLFVNIKKTGLNSVDFCKELLEEAHVLAIPGIAFGGCGEGYIRLACTVGVAALKEAFDRIEKMKVCCAHNLQ
ncbi:aminotransferase, class I and II [Alkaliphilus metalliredigens QYMF]|uniref:Aminotransferase n=1 Tax=Alkaliphilus metalliredigens (strain QYMF) TaxID=293826 RepID=A6TWR5_ALKMQ|nr:pyridoxal phosphate-dependent aminotransferase [Alkaliphilus metalliredigens]ABR50633.1 aminotransferase, class I and II [Alkaliphilus metalliredigens QYMF]